MIGIIFFHSSTTLHVQDHDVKTPARLSTPARSRHHPPPNAQPHPQPHQNRQRTHITQRRHLHQRTRAKCAQEDGEKSCEADVPRGNMTWEGKEGVGEELDYLRGAQHQSLFCSIGGGQIGVVTYSCCRYYGGVHGTHQFLPSTRAHYSSILLEVLGVCDLWPGDEGWVHAAAQGIEEEELQTGSMWRLDNLPCIPSLADPYWRR